MVGLLGMNRKYQTSDDVNSKLLEPNNWPHRLVSGQEWINAKEKMLWECQCGNQFLGSLISVFYTPKMRGRIHNGCFDCWKDKRTLSIREKNQYEVEHKIKKCSNCDDFKDWNKFHKHKEGKHGLGPICIECSQSKQLQRYFGITTEDKQRLYKQQNGLCWFCDKPVPFDKSVIHHRDGNDGRKIPATYKVAHRTCNSSDGEFRRKMENSIYQRALEEDERLVAEYNRSLDQQDEVA